jgi:membrane-associated phospholipid phosphatase
MLAMLVLMLLAAGVGWSRLALGRHTRAEVLLGLALGALAGMVFQGLAA